MGAFGYSTADLSRSLRANDNCSRQRVEIRRLLGFLGSDGGPKTPVRQTEPNEGARSHRRTMPPDSACQKTYRVVTYGAASVVSISRSMNESNAGSMASVHEKRAPGMAMM